LTHLSLQISVSQYLFPVAHPLPAIAHTNPFYQHSAAFFDVPPYMPFSNLFPHIRTELGGRQREPPWLMAQPAMAVVLSETARNSLLVFSDLLAF
jgi:hypothetical protein